MMMTACCACCIILVGVYRIAFDRPFVMAVLHVPTGVPLFVAQLNEPAELLCLPWHESAGSAMKRLTEIAVLTEITLSVVDCAGLMREGWLSCMRFCD